MAPSPLPSSIVSVLALVIAAFVAGCGRNALPVGEGDATCRFGGWPCNGVCVDESSDPLNCGGCGFICQLGTSCQLGQCVPVGSGGGGGTGGGGGNGGGGGGGGDGGGGGGGGVGCASPNQPCGGQCIDPRTDAANCGGCGRRCAAGQMCSDSQCVAGCVAPLSSCLGSCVDLASDAANCGACGHLCSASQTCNGGSCGAPCPTGTAFCHGACTALAADPANCGGCGVTCATDEACSAGLCRGHASIWPTVGGDVHHTGHNPVETGKPPLSLAWSISLGATALWPAVTDATQLFVSSQNGFNVPGTPHLWAVAPADGSVVWQHDFGMIFGLGQPTVHDGHVFVAQMDNYNMTFLHAFVAGNGTLAWSQAFDSQWEHYWSPLVVGNRIYEGGGHIGGLYGFDENGGGQLFYTQEEAEDQWAPLFLDDHVYTLTQGNLRRLNAVSGLVEVSTSVPWMWGGNGARTSPISDGTSLYVVVPPTLFAFAPTFGRPLWSDSAAYAGAPAIADGVVYALSGGQLNALDAATGALSWSFAGDGALAYPPVVAAGVVYVASDANVYAVDLSTHASLWSNTPGGWLSVAAGRLLVASSNGVLTAWTLTP